MPLALDTGHALYGNLLSLICVDDDNNIKDLVGGTLTIDAAVTKSTGTYGRHFTTSQSGGGNALGVTRSVIAMCTVAKPNASIFIALNSTGGSVYGNRPCLVGRSNASYASPTPRVDSSGNVGCAAATLHPDQWTSGVNIHSGSHSLCVVRTGTTSNQSFIDGGNASTLGGQLGFNDDNGIDCIGGHPGTDTWGAVPASFVYVACFDKALNSTEISDLHSSLTGSNAFALVTGGGGGGGGTIAAIVNYYRMLRSGT